MIGEQLLMSFIASAAFAILFNVPKGTLVQCGFVGMFGWLLYISLLKVPADPILATMIASFFCCGDEPIFLPRCIKPPSLYSAWRVSSR